MIHTVIIDDIKISKLPEITRMFEFLDAESTDLKIIDSDGTFPAYLSSIDDLKYYLGKDRLRIIPLGLQDVIYFDDILNKLLKFYR